MRWLALLALLTGCGGCKTTLPPVPPEHWQDASQTKEEAALGDPCHLAGLRLAELGCKEAAPDWDDFCRAELDAGIPLCPTKIAHAATCEEARDACR